VIDYGVKFCLALIHDRFSHLSVHALHSRAVFTQLHIQVGTSSGKNWLHSGIYQSQDLDPWLCWRILQHC